MPVAGGILLLEGDRLVLLHGRLAQYAELVAFPV